ncbi:hypothetical protein ACSGOQ_005882 [Escherichia coli]
MLPFARMVKYGNKAPERADIVIKMQAPSAFTNNTLMLLYKSGDLWGIGGNNAGIFGLGNTTTQTKWVRLMQNVKNFWCTRNASYSLVQTNDNKFYYAGWNLWTGTSSSVQSTTFVECTSYFSGFDMDNIKDIYPNVRNMFLLTNDSILYAIGDNSTYELGSSSSQLTSFTQVNINVKKVSSFFNSPTWIIKNDNSAWRCGSTSTGTLLTGAATATLTTWTKYSFPTGQYPVDIISHNNMLGIVLNVDNTYPLYGLGSQNSRTIRKWCTI